MFGRKEKLENGVSYLLVGCASSTIHNTHIQTHSQSRQFAPVYKTLGCKMNAMHFQFCSYKLLELKLLQHPEVLL